MTTWQVFRDGASALLVSRPTAEEAIAQAQVALADTTGEWTALPWTVAEHLDRERLP